MELTASLLALREDFIRSSPPSPPIVTGWVFLLTIVLVRDLKGGQPDQMFYGTDLDWDARQILSTYACRWGIECTVENCKQLMGLEEQANRVAKAVERIAPMAFFLESIVIVRFPVRPWYPQQARTVLRRHVDDLAAGQ